MEVYSVMFSPTVPVQKLRNFDASKRRNGAK